MCLSWHPTTLSIHTTATLLARLTGATSLVVVLPQAFTAQPSPCHAMLCYAMLCYAMLCYAMLRYATLCYAVPSVWSHDMPCAVLCHACCGVLRPVWCCAVASTLGATFVFPGANQLNAGGTSLVPPYLTGVGAVFIVWAIAPFLTMCTTSAFYLWNRKMIFRTEDPFHRALWVYCQTTPGACVPMTFHCVLSHMQCTSAGRYLLYECMAFTLLQMLKLSGGHACSAVAC